MATDSVIEQVRSAAKQLRCGLLPLVARAQGAASEGKDYAIVENALSECLATLAVLGIWGPENRVPSSEIWNVAGDILTRGWLQHQAWRKPRGYAGDFEMLARIHDRQLCDDPLGRLFDRYFQAQAAPQAVRHRMQMVTDEIVKWVRSNLDETRIVSFGSGPGLDVLDSIEQLSPADRPRATFTLMDLDPRALEFAQARLEPHAQGARLHFVNENLFRLAKNPRVAKWLDGADLVFCTGLFDYLDDSTAAAMLSVLWQQIAAGGKLWVFNFSPVNPTRAYMEWLGNWYLTYRSEGQLQSLAALAGIPPECFMFGAEPLEVNLFVAATKPA